MPVPYDALDDVSDEALLLRYGQGDGAAGAALTLRLTPRVLAYAARLLADRAEAEDVAQEAMLRLWRIAPEWRTGEARVTTWLYRVVTNLCTDRQRKARRVAPLEAAGDPAEPGPGGAERMMEAARARQLQQALADLPARQRQAVVLRHLEGLSNPEIASIMGVGTEAVESLTARGKRALRDALAARRAELGYENDG